MASIRFYILLFVIAASFAISAQPYITGYNPDSLAAEAKKVQQELKEKLQDAATATGVGIVAVTEDAEKDSAAKSMPDSATDQSVANGQADAAKPTDSTPVLEPKEEWELTLSQVLKSIFLIIITYIVFKYFTSLSEILAERWANFRLLIKRSVPIIRIIGWVIVIYFIIAVIMQAPSSSLITLIASAGIGLTFAAQDILKNIFGGIMIIFDRPFQVGDKIQIGTDYGEVINIGLRTVRLVTPDDNTVSVPNGEIINQSVSNANSGESNCQVVAEFFLPAHIEQHKARDIAYRAAAVSRYVFLNKPIVVLFKNEIHQGRSLLKMRLKAYVLDVRYEFPFASEMTELVMEQFLEKGLVTRQELTFLEAE
ncbi:MAG: mechanosensitive ion channel family protein [Calditrichia bacterium]